jgi:hypothetical protein
VARHTYPPKGERIYRVVWEQEVWAPDPVTAAHRARDLQRDPAGTANVYSVYSGDNTVASAVVEVNDDEEIDL